MKKKKTIDFSKKKKSVSHHPLEMSSWIFNCDYYSGDILVNIIPEGLGSTGQQDAHIWKFLLDKFFLKKAHTPFFFFLNQLP